MTPQGAPPLIVVTMMPPVIEAAIRSTEMTFGGRTGVAFMVVRFRPAPGTSTLPIARSFRFRTRLRMPDARQAVDGLFGGEAQHRGLVEKTPGQLLEARR